MVGAKSLGADGASRPAVSRIVPGSHASWQKPSEPMRPPIGGPKGTRCLLTHWG